MKKNLAVAGKKYQKQDGTEGTEWTNLGILNVNKNGKEYLLLDPKINLAALPIGDNGMVMVAVTLDNNQQGGQQQQAPQQGGYQAPQQQQAYQPPPTIYTDANGNPVPPPQNG